MMRQLLIAIAMLSAQISDRAVSDDQWGQIDDPVLQQRYETLNKELRCLQCQNESIADSRADLAIQLRQKVREQLLAGASDDQILNYMTDRYGDFVRFRTPLKAKTVFIWGAPILALILGSIVVFRIMRVRIHQPIDDEPDAGAT
jgi:cytochrome c-type biogenesis protein CcmH